jgi:hypothetical protein
MKATPVISEEDLDVLGTILKSGSTSWKDIIYNGLRLVMYAVYLWAKKNRKEYEILTKKQEYEQNQTNNNEETVDDDVERM